MKMKRALEIKARRASNIMKEKRTSPWKTKGTLCQKTNCSLLEARENGPFGMTGDCLLQGFCDLFFFLPWRKTHNVCSPRGICF